MRTTDIQTNSKSLLKLGRIFKSNRSEAGKKFEISPRQPSEDFSSCINLPFISNRSFVRFLDSLHCQVTGINFIIIIRRVIESQFMKHLRVIKLESLEVFITFVSSDVNNENLFIEFTSILQKMGKDGCCNFVDAAGVLRATHNIYCIESMKHK